MTLQELIDGLIKEHGKEVLDYKVLIWNYWSSNDRYIDINKDSLNCRQLSEAIFIA